MKLYKYLDERSVDILENKRLLIKQIDQLNDPFEFQLTANTNITFDTVLEDITTDEIAAQKVLDFFKEKNIYQDENLPNFINWFKQNGREHIDELKTGFVPAIRTAIDKTYSDYLNKTIRLISFSARSHSIVMWSHYAKQHQGILFKFESDYFPKAKIEGTDAVVQVKYKNSRVRLPPTISVRNKKVSRALMALPETKYRDWLYEQEYRILVEFTDENNPYVDINPRAIEEIVLGLKCDSNTEMRVKELLKKSEYNHVSLKKASMDFDKFALNYNQI